VAAINPASLAATSGASPIGKVGQPRPRGERFSEVLSKPTIGHGPAPSPLSANPAGELLTRLQDGGRRLDRIIAEARKGATFRPRELLAMQAEVYRLSEEISLINKVVEEGVSSVRRVWSMQV